MSKYLLKFYQSEVNTYMTVWDKDGKMIFDSMREAFNYSDHLQSLTDHQMDFKVVQIKFAKREGK